MRVAPFHSVNETKKPIEDRVYHNNNACPSGRDIPRQERLPGNGGYRQCKHCKRL